MRILIVKLTSFGDVIHTFPAITDLKAAHPSVEIDWLVEEAFAPFVALHPAIDTIHTFAFRKLRSKAVNWPRLSGEALKLSRKLRARKYDLVVDLQIFHVAQRDRGELEGLNQRSVWLYIYHYISICRFCRYIAINMELDI